MEFFLNAGLGIGVFMLMLLSFKRQKKREDYLFLSWIATTLLQITFYLVNIYHFELSGIWAILAFALPLLGAPLLFLYIQTITGYGFSLKTAVIHLSIYPIYVFLFFAFKEMVGVEIKAMNGFLGFSRQAGILTEYYAIPLAISGLLYSFWDLALLRKHMGRIANLFSFDENISLRWLNYVVYSYLMLFLLASFLIFGAIHFDLLSLKNAFASVGILLSIMLLAFGFYGFRQTAIFSNTELPVSKRRTAKASYSKSGLDQNKIEDLAQQLSKFMETERPYLNENLNLKTLSETCKLQQAQLSQLINQHFKMNFYDFVNQYRVKEVKVRLSSSEFDQLSILGIAFDCGFKSKSSFNRYFKKYAGVSPSEFKKNLLK
ncbi:MAG: helix-turn-helix domain-containing protein [Maribacter sp.]|uniref:helix-turn-helix domain-containing protein n=1 Tax=Maribacter sp. TaxID=1897614 RepID=UPI00329969BF